MGLFIFSRLVFFCIRGNWLAFLFFRFILGHRRIIGLHHPGKSTISATFSQSKRRNRKHNYQCNNFRRVHIHYLILTMRQEYQHEPIRTIARKLQLRNGLRQRFCCKFRLNTSFTRFGAGCESGGHSRAQPPGACDLFIRAFQAVTVSNVQINKRNTFNTARCPG